MLHVRAHAPPALAVGVGVRPGRLERIRKLFGVALRGGQAGLPVEDELREEQNNSLIEGTAIHLYDEVAAILDYVPAGWEADEDEDDDEGDEEDEFPEIEDEEAEDKEDAEKLKADASLRWDEEDDEEEDDYESEEESDEEEDEDEDER